MNGSSDGTANVQPASAGATMRTPTSISFLRREGVGWECHKKKKIPASNSGVELLFK